jgi:hypothetical protein
MLSSQITGWLVSVCRGLGARCWILDAGCSMLDTRCWILDAGCWILDAGCSMLDAGCSILDAGCSMLDTGCSMAISDCWMPVAGHWQSKGLRCKVKSFSIGDLGYRISELICPVIWKEQVVLVVWKPLPQGVFMVTWTFRISVLIYIN